MCIRDSDELSGYIKMSYYEEANGRVIVTCEGIPFVNENNVTEMLSLIHIQMCIRDRGEDLVLYESHDDLMDKCNYYLVHDAERRQIAANGYGKVKEFHNFEVRFNEIFDIVFNQKKDV